MSYSKTSLNCISVISISLVIYVMVQVYLAVNEKIEFDTFFQSS